MFCVFVGLTAIEVSLCGPFVSQSVLTFVVLCVGVVQIAVPVATFGPFAHWVSATGAGASETLWVMSIGCGLSSESATAVPRPSATTETTTAVAGSRLNRRKTTRNTPYVRWLVA